jgi:Fe-S-cluster containining protein
MQYPNPVKMNNEVFRPFEGNTFHFNCHKDIPCFNKCCAKLRLILTPYDILRMKKRLGLSSEDFLERYTETVIDKHSRFPMVKLKMNAEKNEICPFVTEQGCAIYEDRPGACRLYPLGRASTFVEAEKDARERFFVVSESHCLGFQDGKTWKLDEWLNHEGVSEYNTMNDQWLEIVTSSKTLGAGNAAQKHQVFFLASYNLDKFRRFIFESKFFDLFDVTPDLKRSLADNDVALMKFGFEWLKFSLFGEKTIKTKSRALPDD